MKEERLQEIKDSVEFQYTLAKAKGFDNALLFTNEEEELIEEIERLNKCYCERTDCSGRIKNSKKYESMQEEIERLNKIINEITIFIKHDYFKAREFKEKIQRSELCQGDYPIAYYHADWLEDITDVYLNKLQELKGE